MGFVIFGSRSYGRVDAHGGEFAHTQFFHIDFVPLFPLSSFWVTEEIDGEYHGVEIKLHLKSVVATYLRVWGAVAAVAAFVLLPGMAGVALASGLAALSAWSWTWRSRRGARAQLRSDVNALAFGLRCDPEYLTDHVRQDLSAAIRTQWDQRHSGRSPDEVARYGTQDASEAIVAYGLLRLAAAERGRAGAAERAAANRLIDGTHDTLPAEIGPYRAAASATGATPIADVVTRLAQVTKRPPRTAAPRGKRRWRDQPVVQLVGLAFLSLMAVSIAKIAWTSIAPPVPITARALESVTTRTDRNVVVAVEEIIDAEFTYDTDGDTKRLVFGRIGERLLPITMPADDAMPGLQVSGRLRMSVGSDTGRPWLQAVRAEPALDAATFDYYIQIDSGSDARFSALVGLALTAGTLALWVLWVRARLRRRRRA